MASLSERREIASLVRPYEIESSKQSPAILPLQCPDRLVGSKCVGTPRLKLLTTERQPLVRWRLCCCVPFDQIGIS
jgi:hypothetical protein